MEIDYDASTEAGRAEAHAEIDRRTKGKFTMTLEKHIGTRTAAQNRLLWWMYPHVAIAMEEQGWAKLDKDGVHHEMRMEFLYTAVVNPRTGEERKIPKSTRKLNVREFSAYVENILKFAADLGYAIPMPGDWLSEIEEMERKEQQPKETRHAA